MPRICPCIRLQIAWDDGNREIIAVSLRSDIYSKYQSIFGNRTRLGFFVDAILRRTDGILLGTTVLLRRLSVLFKPVHAGTW